MPVASDTQQNGSFLPPVPSVVNTLSDGIGDTRAGQIGVSESYSREDHIHPITAIVAPPTPTITVAGGAMTITPVLVAATVTQEESVTFQMRVQCNIPIHTGVWQILLVPSIAGYKAPIVNINGTYRQTGNPRGYPPAPCMVNEATLWGGNTIYIGGVTENVATIRHIAMNITYVIA